MQRIFRPVLKYFNSSFGRHCRFYLLYLFLIWFIHLLLSSLLLFIHLQMNHSLKIVDEWFFQNAWGIVLTSKLVSLFMSLYLVSLWSDRRKITFLLLRQGWSLASPKIIFLVFYFWIVFLCWGKFSLKEEFDLFKILVSSLGVFFFYFSDLFLVATLRENFKISPKETLIQFALFPLLFLISAMLTFPYRKYWGIEVALFFLAFMLFIFQKNIVWIIGIIFFLFLVLPAALFLGMDPLWRDSYSIGKMQTLFSNFEWIVVFTLGILYWILPKLDKNIFFKLKMIFKENVRGIRES